MSNTPRLAVATLLTALLGSALVAVTGPAAQAADKDCADFPSQRAAQVFFLRHGGPASDPHRLDADSDGVACESNPAPYYYGSTLPGGSSGPKPPTVVTSKVRLAASRRAAIAGERLSMRVTVTPRTRRPVVLQRQRGRGWTDVVAGRTSRRGLLVIQMRTGRATARYRAVAPSRSAGHKRYTAATSGPRRVVALRQAVRLSLPRSTAERNPVRAVVTASPARRARPVLLQRRTAQGWRVVGRGNESASGRERFRVAAPAAGAFAYRAVVRRWHGAAAVSSSQRRLRVRDVTPPPTPTGLAPVPGDRRIRLTWDAVKARDLARYVVERAGSARGPWTVVGRAGPRRTAMVVTGLRNGRRYFFTVSAVDSHRNRSARSARVAAVPHPPADRTPPAVPTRLAATPGDGLVRLAWAAVGDADLAGYRVYRQVDAGWVEVLDVIGVSAEVGGLTNGTTYTFAVASVDRSGNRSDLSGPASATPAAPEPPANP